MIIRDSMPAICSGGSSQKKLERNNISFSALKPDVPEPLYHVKNKNVFKRMIPGIAFAGSIVTAVGYLLGGLGLLYDLHHDKKHNNPSDGKKNENGVKTVTANSTIGNLGMKSTKVAITAAAVANIACGIGEGIPLMALGEASNLGAANIIETPVGTGLFGIGIASIFAGLALDNTPELKLNEFDVMAQKGLLNKSKLAMENMGVTAKEIGSSIFQIIANSYKPDFWKDNIFRITPKTVVFSETINKDGVVKLEKSLRHQKNYLMHAASFTLAIGGGGLILSSLLNRKKEQKASLKLEEGGFLFDNFGITKYGLDRYTTGSKKSGASFVVGGLVNAVSQFIGIDNKDGRALQWLGIAGVFAGYTVDRGKTLSRDLKNSAKRPELRRIVREWKIDLSKVIDNKAELNALLKDIKLNQPTENSKFMEIEKVISEAIGDKQIKSTENVKNKIESKLSKDVFGVIQQPKLVLDVQNTKETLAYCSEKIFGKNPQKVERDA